MCTTSMVRRKHIKEVHNAPKLGCLQDSPHQRKAGAQMWSPLNPEACRGQCVSLIVHVYILDSRSAPNALCATLKMIYVAFSALVCASELERGKAAAE